MKKWIVCLVVCLAFTLPMLAWALNSTFQNTPIQANPTFGQGERFVGNTQVQIIAPAATIENVAPAPELPGEKLPEGQNVILPDPLKVQPSQVSK
jgi:hypothetical protein